MIHNLVADSNFEILQYILTDYNIFYTRTPLYTPCKTFISYSFQCHFTFLSHMHVLFIIISLYQQVFISISFRVSNFEIDFEELFIGYRTVSNAS
ncbi:hypothetical protein CI610_03288 [invertebrate metagenome]|uniref:Uncharacterized protein n=1 Tax=invertebrate metagenome TaxID=1711999 RepID=A0A2H9T3I6_9ZZZZ